MRYLSMLAGFTFFSHQIGSFLGAWLGGKLYDTLGSYDLVWYLSIALGILAGLINLPIDEKEIARPLRKRRHDARSGMPSVRRFVVRACASASTVPQPGAQLVDRVGDDRVHAPLQRAVSRAPDR